MRLGRSAGLRRLRDTPFLLVVFEAQRAALFPMAILTIFWQRQVGLSMLQIMVVQCVFSISQVAFELPAGMLSDRFGYRRCLAFAAVLMFVGSFGYCFTSSLAGVLVAELVLGAAAALVSGTDLALLYESLLLGDREADFAVWVARRQSVGQAAEGFAALVAGGVYSLSPRLPFLLQAGLWLSALWVVLRMNEPLRPAPIHVGGADARSALYRMVHQVAISNPALRAVVAMTVVLGLSVFIPVWYIQIYAVNSGLPIAWLGPFWCAANLAVAAGALASRAIDRRLGLSRALLLCWVLGICSYWGLGLVPAVWGVLFYFGLTFMRGVFEPMLHHREQRLLPSGERAAYISLRNWIFRIAFLICGPLVGWALDEVGARNVSIGLGLALLAISFPLWLHMFRLRLPEGGVR